MSPHPPAVQRVEAGVLDIAYERHGDPTGWPVVLLHGFPYDARGYDEVVPLLVATGADVVVPYLRGYGLTRFLDGATPRSGQQAALGHDLLALIEALDLDRPVVAGYDWGGRAACVVAALWPDRVSGLVTAAGYAIQDIPGSVEPAAPEVERTFWYQYYFHGERGRAGLARHRRDLAGVLWREWSPTLQFTDADLDTTAHSFDTPDFVDVVVHSYRHRYGLVAGDPAYEDSEQRLTEQPRIDVPTVALDGRHDTITPARAREQHAPHFSRLVDHRVIDSGHEQPREAPDEVARAVLDLRAGD